jgi:PhzF family phenazine biosynthesis protein
MMGIPIYQVDAFTDQPFRGNPAAVCLLDGPAGEEWMQNVGAEMNLAETAFLWPEGESFRLRWFTPSAAVDLCGHATLASAHVLWETGRLAADVPAKFVTKSGVLTARRSGAGITLDFPATPPTPADPPESLFPALGVEPEAVRYVGRSPFDYLIEVDRESALRELNPDFRALSSLHVRGAIVTAKPDAGSEFDFLSRFFAPAVGVNEDPVTGSAHCCLTPYWSAKLGKEEMYALQVSAREGRIRVALRGDRVDLTGGAVTVTTGVLLA